MSSRGKRYDRYDEPKLNIKKVFAVIMAIIVIIMIIIMVKNILSSGKEKGKITSQSYYTCFKNNKWGVINSTGDTVIDPSYQEYITIPNNKKDVFICTYDVNYEEGTYKTKALNSKNEEIFKEYQQIEVIQNFDENQNTWYEENVLKIQKDNKYGLIDLNGKEILPAEYEEITPITGIKDTLKIKKDGKYGVVSCEGNQIINIEYEEITNLGKTNKDGFIVKNENGKYGIVDYSNKTIIEMAYNSIEKVYGNGLYVVTDEKTKKIINKEQETIATTEFDSIKNISEKEGEKAGIIFEKNKKYGFMDKEGNIKISPKYDNLIETQLGILIAKKSDSYGIIDLEEEEKLPFENTMITYNKEAEIYIIEDSEYNAKILNSEFEEKLTGILVEINTEKDYIKLREGEQYKYYNFKFEEKPASIFLTENTLFLSKKDGKYGFVDKEGKVIVDYNYDDATEQNSCGYAGIKKDGKWGSIDSKGNVIIEPSYNLDEYLQIDFIGRWHMGVDINTNYYTQETK